MAKSLLSSNSKDHQNRLFTFVRKYFLVMASVTLLTLLILFQNCGNKTENPSVGGQSGSTTTTNGGGEDTTTTTTTTTGDTTTTTTTTVSVVELPDLLADIQELATEYSTELGHSCENWDFIDKVVEELKTSNERFGYNCEDGDCQQISKSQVAFYLGADSETLTTDANDSEDVKVVEVIEDHCSQTSPQAGWTELVDDGRWKLLRTPWIENGKCNNADKYKCKPGRAVNKTEDNQYYKWDCEGFNGGTKETGCQISKQAPVNGKCSTDQKDGVILKKNTCDAGTPDNTGTSDDEEYYHLWICRGANGGTDDNCKKPNNWCDNSTKHGCKDGTTAVDKKNKTNSWEWKCRHDTDNVTSLAQCSKAKSATCGASKNNCDIGEPDDEAVDDTLAEYRWKCTFGSSSKNCHKCKPYGTAQDGKCAVNAPWLCQALTIDNAPTLSPKRGGKFVKDLVHGANGAATWTCRGIYGGQDTACSTRTPACAGQTEKTILCKKSSPINLETTSDGIKWQCRATHTSNPINCTRDKDAAHTTSDALIQALTPVAGACALDCQGTNRRCGAGNRHRPSGSTNSWVCQGINNGANITCQKNRAWGGSPPFGSCQNFRDLFDFSRCPKP